MKKVMILAILLVGISSIAQTKRENGKRQQLEQMTPEQKQELQLKKLTLDLDLSNAQQKEVQVVLSEQHKKREMAMAQRKANQAEAKKPTADERFAMKNKMLDEQIELKSRMKKILSNEQFNKWEATKGERSERMQQRLAMHKERKTIKNTSEK
ncbi:MAG: hypothetical protein ACK4M4_09810 [Flavobacterium sp.]